MAALLRNAGRVLSTRAKTGRIPYRYRCPGAYRNLLLLDLRPGRRRAPRPYRTRRYGGVDRAILPERGLQLPNLTESNAQFFSNGLAVSVFGRECHSASFAVKQPLKSCSLVHDKGSTTVSSLQISVCSEISNASSTSMPRYRTVDSSLECPSSNWTARRFLVRR